MADDVCLTLPEFLELFPEFRATGPKASGAITLTGQPAPGDTITIAPPYDALPVPEVLTAGTDYMIGATLDDTAANIAAALSVRVTAVAVGTVVYMESTSPGAAGQHTITVTGAVFSVQQLAGGDAVVRSAIDAACAQLAPGCYGDKLAMAHGYLAAHLLALLALGGGGPVKSRTIDKIKVEYATSSSSLEASRYGRMFAQIQGSIVRLPVAGRYAPITFFCR